MVTATFACQLLRSDLRHGPTVTFVRAVYGIKGPMLLQSAFTRTPHLRLVLGESDIAYQAYFEAMKGRLVTTLGDFSCKVPSKVLELTRFLAERYPLEVSDAGQPPNDKGYRETAADRPLRRNHGLVQGRDADFLAKDTNTHPESYFPQSMTSSSRMDRMLICSRCPI